MSHEEFMQSLNEMEIALAEDPALLAELCASWPADVAESDVYEMAA